MTTPLDIPESHRALIELLRSAIHRTPLSPGFPQGADWPTLLRQARQHGVDTYLYPWLSEQRPALFSPRASAAPESAPAAWRALYFQEVPRALLRQKQLAAILSAFAQAGVDVVPLKGALLSETVYDDPARRSMSDLDLLVRPSDCDRAHGLLLGLGYGIGVDARRNAFACDQAYHHATHAASVELHWDFYSKACPEDPQPDLASIWQRALPANLLGVPVLAFSPCDQLAHLADHLLHHRLALRLRAYVDVALYLQGLGRSPSASALQEASARWNIGRAVPFIVRFVDALLGCPSETAGWRPDSPAEGQQRQQLAGILLRLPASETMAGEETFLRLRGATGLARLGHAVSRVFMPRDYLALRYPPARHRLGLPLAWALRAWDLFALNREHAQQVATHARSAQNDLCDAAARHAIVRALTETKRPG